MELACSNAAINLAETGKIESEVQRGHLVELSLSRHPPVRAE